MPSKYFVQKMDRFCPKNPGKPHYKKSDLFHDAHEPPLDLLRDGVGLHPLHDRVPPPIDLAHVVLGFLGVGFSVTIFLLSII